MSNLNAALAAAKRGWHVFPIAAGRKKPPLIPDNLNAATTNEAQVRKWWTKWPDANIGVSCGPSGLVVLDVDTKEGKQGANSLNDLLKGDCTSPLLDTLNAYSWSGGRHYFYKGECGSSQSKLGPGLDIKGTGGYVVIAPSFIEEDGLVGQYRWADPGEGEKWPILPFPDLFRPKEISKSPVRDVVQIPEGSRNAELTRRAGLYRRIGMIPSAIGAALRVDNEAMCSTPLPDKEIDAIAKSVGRYAPDPKASEAPKPPPSPHEYRFRTAAELLELTSERVDWVVEDLIRQSGLCLFSARPGAGKSTLMRSLAASVSTGVPFLSRRCKPGKVAWVGIEESRADLLGALEDMGLLENDDIVYATGMDVPPAGAPADRLIWLEAFIQETQPLLVIIDTLGAFFEIEDINHYSSTSKAMNPLLALREKYGTAFVLLHHTKIGADVALGSTKILASFDVSLVMTVSPQGARYIKSDKMRCGVPLEDTVLTFDPETRRMTASEPKWVADKRACEQNLLAYLKPGMRISARELANHAGRRGATGRSAVASLLAQGLLISSGSGRKGDPRLVSLCDPDSESGFRGFRGRTLSHTYAETESEESAESAPGRGMVRGMDAETRGNPRNTAESEESAESAGAKNRSHDQFRFRTPAELAANGTALHHAEVLEPEELPW